MKDKLAYLVDMGETRYLCLSMKALKNTIGWANERYSSICVSRMRLQRSAISIHNGRPLVYVLRTPDMYDALVLQPLSAEEVHRYINDYIDHNGVVIIEPYEDFPMANKDIPRWKHLELQHETVIKWR